jgi:mRNA interferase MazF
VVARRRYVPRRGDVVWLSFAPQAGHKQTGRRPALVLSPAAYNAKVGLALLCPTTNQANGYPFEVALPRSTELAGVVLADQVKSLDWRARHAMPAGRLPAPLVREVVDLVKALLEDGAD